MLATFLSGPSSPIVPLLAGPFHEFQDAAYAPEFGRQYFFGRDMLVAPITEAVDNSTNTSSRSVWLPEGEWVPWVSWGSPSQGESAPLQGPTVVTHEFGLSEVPVFVRAGACIPTRTMASAYDVSRASFFLLFFLIIPHPLFLPLFFVVVFWGRSPCPPRSLLLGLSSVHHASVCTRVTRVLCYS